MALEKNTSKKAATTSNLLRFRKQEQSDHVEEKYFVYPQLDP